MTALRDERGRILPGSTGNPKGRPTGFVGLARKIQQQTRDGDELLEFVFGVLRNENNTIADRKWAVEWLADRGYGKAVIAVDVQAAIQGVAMGGDGFQAMRLGVVPLDDLDALDAALGRVLDVAGVELPRDEPEPALPVLDDLGQYPLDVVAVAVDAHDVAAIAAAWVKPTGRAFDFVGSSNVLRVEHEGTTAIITFANGTRYKYRNFSSDMYDEFVAALSPGAWFARVIRKAASAYPCEKVRGCGTSGPDA